MFYEMYNRRFVCHRNAWFRTFKCERAKAGTLTAAHNAGFHAVLFSFIPICRLLLSGFR